MKSVILGGKNKAAVEITVWIRQEMTFLNSY